MRVSKRSIVVLRTPSCALFCSIWSRFSSMREDSGAEQPRQGQHEERRHGKGYWKQEALLHHGWSATGFPPFTRVMQGISALATAAL